MFAHTRRPATHTNRAVRACVDAGPQLAGPGSELAAAWQWGHVLGIGDPCSKELQYFNIDIRILNFKSPAFSLFVQGGNHCKLIANLIPLSPSIADR